MTALPQSPPLRISLDLLIAPNTPHTFTNSSGLPIPIPFAKARAAPIIMDSDLNNLHAPAAGVLLGPGYQLPEIATNPSPKDLDSDIELTLQQVNYAPSECVIRPPQHCATDAADAINTSICFSTNND